MFQCFRIMVEFVLNWKGFTYKFIEILNITLKPGKNFGVLMFCWYLFSTEWKKDLVSQVGRIYDRLCAVSDLFYCYQTFITSFAF